MTSQYARTLWLRLAGAVLILGVIAQPVFGFHAIPEFFDYSLASAFALGIVDVILLLGGMFLIGTTP